MQQIRILCSIGLCALSGLVYALPSETNVDKILLAELEAERHDLHLLEEHFERAQDDCSEEKCTVDFLTDESDPFFKAASDVSAGNPAQQKVAGLSTWAAKLDTAKLPTIEPYTANLNNEEYRKHLRTYITNEMLGGGPEYGVTFRKKADTSTYEEILADAGKREMFHLDGKDQTGLLCCKLSAKDNLSAKAQSGFEIKLGQTGTSLLPASITLPYKEAFLKENCYSINDAVPDPAHGNWPKVKSGKWPALSKTMPYGANPVYTFTSTFANNGDNPKGACKLRPNAHATRKGDGETYILVRVCKACMKGRLVIPNTLIKHPDNFDLAYKADANADWKTAVLEFTEG